MSVPWVDLGGGVKGKIKLFQNMVMLHIKLKGITGAATCNMVANIMPADPPDPWGQKVKKCSNMVANILTAAPLPRP